MGCVNLQFILELWHFWYFFTWKGTKCVNHVKRETPLWSSSPPPFPFNTLTFSWKKISGLNYAVASRLVFINHGRVCICYSYLCTLRCLRAHQGHGHIQHRIQRPGGGGGGPRNMKSMWPPLAAIFFMTCFYRAGGAMAPSAPPPDPLLTLFKCSTTSSTRFHFLVW